MSVSAKGNFCDIWLHLVWSTKNREPIIEPSWKLKLYDQIRAISEEKDYGLNFINGIEDHVHLLINYRPKYPLSQMVKDFKGLTWRWSRDTLPEQASELKWQDGYSAFSVSPDRVQKVRDYIKNQEKHHLEEDFEQEIQRLRSKRN